MAFRFFNKDGKRDVGGCAVPDCALGAHIVVMGGYRLGKDTGMILTCDRCRAMELPHRSEGGAEIPD